MSDNILNLVRSVVWALNLPHKDIQAEILEQKISLQLFALRLTNENKFCEFALYSEGTQKYPCKILKKNQYFYERTCPIQNGNRDISKLMSFVYGYNYVFDEDAWEKDTSVGERSEATITYYGTFCFIKDSDGVMRIEYDRPFSYKKGDIDRTDDKIPTYDISNGAPTPSLWKIMQPSARYKTLTEAAHFFKDTPKAYSPFHLHPLTNTKFDDGSDSITFSEGELTQLSTKSQTYGCDAHFEDTPGSCVEKVVQHIEIINGRKCQFYRPFTRYRYYASFYTIPIGLPSNQLLLNLPAVRDAETVVFCTDICDAWELQNANKDKNEAFTAALFDRGCFNQVDWTPLRDKKVILLISNHSGLTLAESYIEADRYYQYLRDCEKISDIHFIQREVEYPDAANFTIDAELSDFFNHHPGKVIEDSVLELNEFEYAEMLERAKVEIERKKEQSKDFSFWKSVPSPINNMPAPQEDDSRQEIIRSFLYRGATSMIAGKPCIGKSRFTIALAGYLAGSSKHFLDTRLWTRCGNKQTTYNVAYLEFDSTASSEFQQIKKDVVSNLGDKEKNLIYKRLTGNGINYCSEKNYPALKKMIEELLPNEERSEERKTVDVLIIDTLRGFCDDKFDIARKICSRLNNDLPEMAILLVHHLNTQGSVNGGLEAENWLRARIELSRKGNDSVTLEVPFTIHRGKFNNVSISEDLQDFYAKFDQTSNEFVVVKGPEEESEIETEADKTLRLKSIYKQYKSKKTQAGIAYLLGMSDRTLRDKLNA